MRALKVLIVIGDSREMKEIPDNSVHLVVTSPPYWNLEEYSTPETDVAKGDLGRIADKKEFFKEIMKVWRECYRVLIGGGKLVCIFRNISVGRRETGYVSMINLYGPMVESIEKAGFIFFTEWISKVPFPILDFRKVLDRTYGNKNKIEARSFYNYDYCCVFKKGVTRYVVDPDVSKEEWYRLVDGVWEIWDIGSTTEREWVSGAVHPTKLFENFIKLYTKPGDTVLDPFLGTGTAVLAAINLGRNAIGYEVRPEMKEVIKRKVEWGRSRLFGRIHWKLIDRISGEVEEIWA